MSLRRIVLGGAFSEDQQQALALRRANGAKYPRKPTAESRSQTRLMGFSLLSLFFAFGQQPNRLKTGVGQSVRFGGSNSIRHESKNIKNCGFFLIRSIRQNYLTKAAAKQIAAAAKF